MAAEGETGRTDCVLGFFSFLIYTQKADGMFSSHIYIYTHSQKANGCFAFFFFSSSFFFFFEALLGTLDLRNEKVISLSLSF